VTAVAARMDEIVRAVEPLMRKRGFRKRRHVFARDVGEGLTQSVQLLMGRFEPHPDRRPGLYGAFTLELGVFVDAIAALDGQAKPRFVHPYDCHFRQRVGDLLDGEDVWWELEQPAGMLTDATEAVLAETVLPHLDRLDAGDAVLSAWESGALRSVFASDVNAALLHYAQGHRDESARILRRELGRTQHRGAAETLVALGRRLRLDLTMDDARIVSLLAAERESRV
jgi:Domain of unknown function (DUF4304)